MSEKFNRPTFDLVAAATVTLDQDEKLQLVAFLWPQLTNEQREEFILIEFMTQNTKEPNNG